MSLTERFGPYGLIRLCLVAGIGLALLLGLGGCVYFHPDPEWHDPHLQRMQTERENGLTVSVVVIEDEEAEKIYGVNLGAWGIRAIWLEVTNTTEEHFHLLPTSLDLDYFSQNEAAYRFHSAFRPGQNRRLSDHFHSLAIRKDIRPGEATRGFVLVNRHRGGRYLIVELAGDESLKRFDFMFTLPDGTFDYESVDLNRLYSASQQREVTGEELKAWAKGLPCCTLDDDGGHEGDPINVIFVGEVNHLLGALTRSGWEFTEKVALRSAWETVHSTLLGRPEWNFPVSPLYFFGRHQDFSMQRPRGSIPQRNHMRLWLSPLTHQGASVWVGQLSRDIGIKPTWHSPFLFTHVIDPEVDEDRSYLLELLIRSQSVSAFAYTSGVGRGTRNAPRYNLSGDPYRTDGRRLIIWLSEEPVPVNRVQHRH